ncbi:hypothetical protein [Mucilaginibacter sp. CSA2-8R]|uniref:hypothetical protein n=1 Tax=Mucilaginibacter sp. CSA2-8R TaxID=3141542 RepID=UPI00315D3E78
MADLQVYNDLSTTIINGFGIVGGLYTCASFLKKIADEVILYFKKRKLILTSALPNLKILTY